MIKRNFVIPDECLLPSLFSSVSDINPDTINWEDLIHLIRSSENIKTQTEHARYYLKEGNKKLYSIYKSQSGAFTPAAQCVGGHSASHIKGLTMKSMVDLDGVNPSQIPQLLNIIRKDPHTFIAYVTCSGQGIRIIYPFTTDQSEISYLDAWRFGNEYYRMITNVEHDKSTKDPTRLSFLCHDADCYFNPDAKPFFIKDEPIEPITNETPIEQPIAFAEDILHKQGMQFVEGQRNHFLINAAFLLNKMGVDKQQVIDHYSNMHDDPQEVNRAVDWAYSKGVNEYATWKTRAPKRAEKSLKSDDPEKKKDIPSRAKFASPEQIRQYLNNDIELRYNCITTLVEYHDPKSGQWMDADDRIINALWENACKEKKIYFKQCDFLSEINSAHTRTFNPFKEYLDSLPQWNEGDTDYIAELASRVETDCDHELFERCLRKWIVGLVASWVVPEIVNQVILTFIGGQGMFKSTFFRKLLPPELSRYFLAKGNSTYLSKDDKLSTSTYAMICLEEIDSMKDADLNTIKALVTTVVISERAAYARNRENRTHIASFCATGNNMQFLTDVTGNRRWLPFLIKHIRNPYENPINYEGLYGQIRHLIESGYQYWFTAEEDAEMEAYKQQFAEPCPEEELVLRYFREPKPGEIAVMKTASMIAARCSVDLRYQISTKKVGMVLNKIGFRKTAIHGTRGYLVVERTFEEIRASEINDATEAMKEIKKDAA